MGFSKKKKDEEEEIKHVRVWIGMTVRVMEWYFFCTSDSDYICCRTGVIFKQLGM